LTALIIQRENAGGKLILADPHAIGVSPFSAFQKIVRERRKSETIP
jgi:hypothetical protein